MALIAADNSAQQSVVDGLAIPFITLVFKTMTEWIDTGELLREIERWRQLMLDLSLDFPLIEKCAVAIQQLQNRLETERRKCALAEERVTALLIEAEARQIAIKMQENVTQNL